jgi:hypothetical protein
LAQSSESSSDRASAASFSATASRCVFSDIVWEDVQAGIVIPRPLVRRQSFGWQFYRRGQ